MNVRETMLQTVKCQRSNRYSMVQDTVINLNGDSIHVFKCRDFYKCAACLNCQYHQSKEMP